MSSPKRRIETDMMKLCVCGPALAFVRQSSQLTVARCDIHLVRSLMSDYEVNLVNDNMQEFFVKFKGPEESESSPSAQMGCSSARLTERWRLVCTEHGEASLTSVTFRRSPVCRRCLEDSRRAAGRLPVQVALDRLPEQDLSP